jgi:uncharacterized protein with FMN-binding domain
MKKIFAAVVIVGLSAVYIFSRMSTDTSTVAPVATTNPTTTTTDVSTTPVPSAGTPPPTPAPTPAPVATPAKTGYKDGVYTGKVVDATYGLVQVKATIKNGVITSVTFPQYPNHAGHTTEVSNQVMPYYAQEAIKSQKANVSTISGATQTVDGFNESLANALAQAKA